MCVFTGIRILVSLDSISQSCGVFSSVLVCVYLWLSTSASASVSLSLCLSLVSLYLSLSLTHAPFSLTLPPTVSFLPAPVNSDSGGGGERVLWQAVRAVQQAQGDKIHVVIYTGDDAPGTDILKRAESRFHIPALDADEVEFVRLKYRALVEDTMYPRFTLLGQSLGSMVLGFEALLRCPPHLFIETTGYAFTYPVARLGFGAKVACYTHYPTISTDMLRRVQERRPTYNNDERVAGSRAASSAKVIYYQVFAWLYGFVGRFSSVVMVNSNWTANHVRNIWKCAERTTVVYPPCDTTTLQRIPLGGKPSREPLVISIGQFRPEKDHMLQLDAFNEFVQKCGAKRHDNDDQKSGSKHRLSDVKLVMIGGCRNPGDEERIAALRKRAKELGLSNRVKFAINVSFDELLDYVGRAIAGLHTMWNEHFGIGVVEFMAAGVIPIAHNSGGPKADIVLQEYESHSFSGGGGNYNGPLGFLSATKEEYADSLLKVMQAYVADDHMDVMRETARRRAREFSDESFIHNFNKALQPIV
jgi:alpha-1,2-mannosyltransferase